MLGPADERRLMDPEASCRILLRQQSSVSKSIVAQAQPVTMDEIGHSQGRKPCIASAASRRSSRPKSVFVEELGDLGISVIVEELVDTLNDLRRRLDLLRGGLGVQRRQRLGLATLKAHVDLGGS